MSAFRRFAMSANKLHFHFRRLFEVLCQSTTRRLEKSPYADTPTRLPADTFPQDADPPIRRPADPLIRFPWCLLFATIFGLVLPSRTLAQTYLEWNIPNASNGLWTTASNWSPATVPSSTSYGAVIGDNATVVLSSSETIFSLNLADSSNASYNSANLTLSGGATLTTTSYALIGSYETVSGRNTGIFTVSGSGTNLTNGAALLVGYGGTGTFNLTTSATATPTGAISLNVGIINLGSAGTGTVNINGAGQTTATTMTAPGPHILETVLVQRAP